MSVVRTKRRGMVARRIRVHVDGVAQPEHECPLDDALGLTCRVTGSTCVYWLRRDGWLPEGCPLLAGPVTISGVMQEEQT